MGSPEVSLAAIHTQLGRLAGLTESNAELLREIRDQVRTINGRVTRSEGRIDYVEGGLRAAAEERRVARGLIDEVRTVLQTDHILDGVALTKAQLRAWMVGLAALASAASAAASMAVKVWG